MSLCAPRVCPPMLRSVGGAGAHTTPPACVCVAAQLSELNTTLTNTRQAKAMLQSTMVSQLSQLRDQLRRKQGDDAADAEVTSRVSAFRRMPLGCDCVRVCLVSASCVCQGGAAHRSTSALTEHVASLRSSLTSLRASAALSAAPVSWPASEARGTAAGSSTSLTDASIGTPTSPRDAAHAAVREINHRIAMAEAAVNASSAATVTPPRSRSPARASGASYSGVGWSTFGTPSSTSSGAAAGSSAAASVAAVIAGRSPHIAGGGATVDASPSSSSARDAHVRGHRSHGYAASAGGHSHVHSHTGRSSSDGGGGPRHAATSPQFGTFMSPADTP